MDEEEMTEYGRGFSEALTDADSWLDKTTRDWYSLGLVDDRQMLVLRDLVHNFEISFLYEYTGA